VSGTRPRYAFAHRGGRAHGRDNTLDTFRGALARGATGLETDAWLTADGAVVLDHDGVLRTASGKRQLSDVRRDALPAHMPTLAELYTACGTAYDLAIDVKSYAVGAAAAEVAEAHGAADRLWLVGGGVGVVREWRESGGAAHLALTINSRSRLAAVAAAAAQAGAEAVNMRWPWWTRGFARRMHDLGLLAFGYDAQSRFALRRCVRLGLDGVFSDHVERMHEVLAQ
jgi:glycerophosphoryl diester phosphodiesterase